LSTDNSTGSSVTLQPVPVQSWSPKQVEQHDARVMAMGGLRRHLSLSPAGRQQEQQKQKLQTDRMYARHAVMCRGRADGTEDVFATPDSAVSQARLDPIRFCRGGSSTSRSVNSGLTRTH